MLSSYQCTTMYETTIQFLTRVTGSDKNLMMNIAWFYICPYQTPIHQGHFLHYFSKCYSIQLPCWRRTSQ